MDAARTWKKNANGFKDSGDTYRTFDGAHHSAWLICPTESRIAKYRAAGVRCRRVKDVLYVHVVDEDIARSVDQASEDWS